MDELISKRAVIEAIEKARANVGHNLERSIGKSIIEILDEVGRDVDRLPPAQQNLQQTCNQLANDTISRQAAIDAADLIIARDKSGNNDIVKAMTAWKEWIKALPPAPPETIYCKDCGHRDDYGCCKYWKGLAMSETPIATDDYDFCNHARRREREH